MSLLAAARLSSADTLRLGDIAIHRVADMAGVGWPVERVFSDLDDAALRAAAERYPGCAEPEQRKLMLDFNSYIIDMPGCLCLIDAGIGNDKERPDRPLWHRRSGDFLERIVKLGFALERFDIVINTHLHADHVGFNTLREGENWVPAFPNATYLVPEIELAHVEQQTEREPLDHILHGAYADSVKPIADAGLYKAVPLPSEIAPGLWLEPAPGHTMGMAVVRLRSADCDVLFLADAVHSPIQLATPSLTSNFCVDRAQSAATRHRLLDACAGTNTIVATYHFPPPVFGRIVRSGAGYALEPVT